jgi:hypothetical protein
MPLRLGERSFDFDSHGPWCEKLHTTDVYESVEGTVEFDYLSSDVMWQQPVDGPLLASRRAGGTIKWESTMNRYHLLVAILGAALVAGCASTDKRAAVDDDDKTYVTAAAYPSTSEGM